jgi:hypothetical protein
MIHRFVLTLVAAALLGGYGGGEGDATTRTGPAARAPSAAAGAWALLQADTPVVAGDTVRTPAALRLFGGPDSPLGDLAVRFRARGEFGGDWARFRPCDAGIQGTCSPGLIPRLQPDVQVSLEAAGSVGGRLFIDVDYDQTREFGGANRFQVYLQGLPGETLERVELGDVTFALPDSRFLTRGIPAGNFGLLAQAGSGSFRVQGVVAQQQGSRQTREFRLRGGEGGLVREDTLVIEDAQYVQGQFFFLVDPTLLAGAPHVDVLNLRPADARPEEAPGAEPIQLWRMERDPALRQPVEGYVRADASLAGPNGAGGETVRESGWFRYLRPGVDYYLHPSGLWVALRVPLRPDEALAVSYINVLGDTIGEYNPERVLNEGGIPALRLVRATAPRHQPGRPTWERELRQVYRLSSSEAVELDALELRISLGEDSGGRTFVDTPSGRRIPFLRVFGLDRDPPFERVDRRALFQPGGDDPLEAGVVGSYLILPSLRPFLDPGPLPSEGLTAAGVQALLGGNANRRIYEAEDPLERDAAGLYRLNLTLRTRSTGVATSFPIGAFGVLEGSERIYLGDRLLRPGIDYLLDPEVGMVTLLQPEFLLARSSSDRLRITWEQASLFRPRPTTLLGGNAEMALGERGSVNLLGLYQAEQEILTRPRFGAEPGAAGMLGVRTQFARETPGVDRLARALLGVSDRELGDGGGELRVEAEVAVSLPNPNVSGDAYLDDFDAGDERTISLLASNWHLGSAPASPSGLGNRAPSAFGVPQALPLVWQHTWVEPGPSGDSTGVFEGFFPRSDIDRQISIVGTEVREPGLLLSFGSTPGTLHPEPRWRSVTTLLSPTGVDLSQAEFLDFYVADGDALTLVLDLGAVSEDAFFIDEGGRTSGFREDTGRPWGLGTLDQEADPLRGEIWDRDADARGVWPESCLAEPGRVYPVGDPTANCTRGNGRRDTEDLNGNGILDTEERAARYVIQLDGSSPYLVRSRQETGTRFRLYRVPLRGPDTDFPGGSLTTADWRAIQFLRMTVVGERSSRLTVARMRFVGSRWAKRGGEGVLRGIGGDTVSMASSFEVTPVSVLTEGAAYQAPPGVLEQLDDPASAVGGRGVEISEKSLALRIQGLAPGDRAEVYSRFFQRPRDFLGYGELRLWALAREGDFGTGSDGLRVFVKVGTDPDNFYLWSSPLDPAPDPQGVTPGDWLPERVLDFGPWIQLRREAEEELLRRGAGALDDPVVVWSADSTRAVVLTDRARAPNLAAVRELSLGVWNPGGVPGSGEVWFNELRLGAGVRTPGNARHLTVELDGGSAYQFRVGYQGTSPRFRSLQEGPTYQDEGVWNVSGSLQLGRALPSRWAVDLPVTVSHFRTGQDPLYLAGTDLEARAIPGLRAGGISETRAALTLRTAAETGVASVDRVLSALDARVAVQRSSVATLTTESEAAGFEAGLGFELRPFPRETDLVPRVLEPLIRILFPPGMARRLNAARFQWTPSEIGAGTGLRRRELRVTRYGRTIAGAPGDPGVVSAAPEAWLDSRFRVAFQPGGTVTASMDLLSERDLLDPESTLLGPGVTRLIAAERRKALGMDLGWETRRHLLVRIGMRPEPFRGVRTEASGQSRYGMDRNAGLVRMDPFPVTGAGELLRNVRVDRELRVGGVVDPGVVLFGHPGPPPVDLGLPLRRPSRAERIARRVSPLSIVLQDGIVSAFFREGVEAGPGFQLGLGGTSGLGALDGVRAASVVQRRTVTVGSGVRLPASLFLNLNLQDTRVASLDRRSERDGWTRSWPDVRFGASNLPLPEEWAGRLDRVAITSGVLRVQDKVRYGEQLQARTRSELRLPVEVTLEFAGGVTARYRGTISDGEGTDPTGRTGREQSDHGISLETRFRPRAGLDTPLGGAFRLSFLGQYTHLEECRVPTGTDGCVPFLVRTTRSASLGLDTVLQGFEVGAQVAWLDRVAFSAFETGFRQFQVGIWGRMEFAAGPVERLDRRRVPPDPFRR